MAGPLEKRSSEERPLVLAAIHDEKLWRELEGELDRRFRVRRETDGLRAMDVLLLLRPAAVIAETGLPSLSGILLARLIGHNRHLSKLPVALILSREYRIEEFWAREAGAVVTVTRRGASKAAAVIETAIGEKEPVSDESWDKAEQEIKAHGGPAAGVASGLELQLLGASILALLGEIDIGSETPVAGQQSTIPSFIGQALAALATVLEFAQAGIALFESDDLYVVENEAFREVLDEEAFVRESKESASLYIKGGNRPDQFNVTKLRPVRHEFPGPRDPASTYFALPLSGRRGTYGVLCVMTYKDIAVREYYLRTLSLIGAQLSVSLERALFYEEVRRLSVTDHLTGLSNRRALISRLELEFRRSVRYRTPLSVAICDLDGFKKINDKHGHDAGDKVLKETAAILMRSVREIDLAGRWGGEELALLFPQTDLEGAVVACERVRRQVETHRVDFRGAELGVTLSIGVASMNHETLCARSPDALMTLADHAMYLAKSRGKNKVAHFLDLDPTAPSESTQPVSHAG